MRAQVGLVLGIGLTFACQQDERVHAATVSFAELTNPRSGERALAGFGCSASEATDAGAPVGLLQRAVSEVDGQTSLRATIVVDAVRLNGGYPGCRLSAIANFCNAEAESCAVMTGQRRCFDLEPLAFEADAGTGTGRAGTRLGAIFADYVRNGLTGRMLTDRAVDDEVLLRAVGTTQRCAELEASGSLEFAREQLLGCTYSCPLVLSTARGDIVLDSEAIGRCEEQIYVCASPAFTPVAVENALPSVP